MFLCVGCEEGKRRESARVRACISGREAYAHTQTYATHPMQWDEEAQVLRLNMETVKRCYQECVDEGKKVPMFIYTNPHNPSGGQGRERER